jgi:predicted GNAT family N-acyltransferase
MIATSKSARRKGFGHMLVQQIIWQISGQSKKPIILHATQKGEGLYAKSGFLPCNQFFLYRFLNTQP